MFLDINTMGREGVAFDHTLRVDDLEGAGGEKVKVSAVRLRGEAERVAGGVELAARLEAKLEMQCSRCLESFTIDVDTELRRLLVADPEEGDTPAPRVAVDEDEDEETLHVAGGRAVLEDIVTEQLYLSLPLKPVCSPDCKGLCPRCGTNRNLGACECGTGEVDPRLAPLLEFKRRQERS